MFSTENYKGTRNYLHSQKKYEVLRTCLYFGISLSLFIAGYIATKSRLNLLTIVAVLGCLPASKSAVGMIMFLRFKGCSSQVQKQLCTKEEGLSCLYDMVFTSYQKNYQVSHLAVRGNTVCGYTEDPSFCEADFYKHINGFLKAEGYKNVSVKIFGDLTKYLNRLEGMKELEEKEEETQGIIAVLKSVAL